MAPLYGRGRVPVRPPSTPSTSPRTTRFAGKEAETTGFAVKRLDWLTADNTVSQSRALIKSRMVIGLNGKSNLGQAGGSGRVAKPSGWVCDGSSDGGVGGGSEGDLVAEVFELTDEVSGFPQWVEMALVPVRSEFLISGLRVVDQVPDDDED